MKRLLSILLALFSIFSCTFQDYEVGKSMETIITKATGAVYENDIPYSFQSVNNKEFWSTCKCFEDRIAACEVPEEYLSGMTTMALLKTCIDYPLIYCYSAYENELQAVKAISEFSNVYMELINRSDAADAIIDFYSKATVRTSVDSLSYGRNGTSLSLTQIHFLEILRHS